MMEFQFTEEQEKFRSEIRDFLEEELKNGTFKPFPDPIRGFNLDFTHKLAKKGWIGITWPKRYGGQERTYVDRLILTEELLRYGAPAAAHWIGDRQVGPSIIAYGSEQLKEEFLTRMVRGEVSFCIGISEPNAGSDVASLKTKAREEGDYFVIDGQKIWTSAAQRVTHIYVIARTDLTAEKHMGLSEFIFDINLPGITIRPITDVTGTQEFNEVFLDKVKVHKRYLLGEKNQGWKQITSQLVYERAGIERLMYNYPVFDALLSYVREGKKYGKPLIQDSLIRDKVSQLKLEFEVGRLLCYKIVWLLDQGKTPAAETAMVKFFCTEFEKRMVDTVMEILGPYGLLLPGSKWAPFRGMAAFSYLLSPGYSIQGGTNEILKSIVAMKELGLRDG